MHYARTRNNWGSALIFTMIAIGILTAIVSTSMQRSTIDTKLSASWSQRTRTFEVADTGLQLIARKILDQYRSTGSFNSLLGTIQLGSSGGGQYSVVVADNGNVGGVDQDGDGNDNVDRDQIVRMISTGLIGDSQQSIEAFFRVQASAGPTPPDSSGIGALGICGTNADITRASNISGVDYNPPPYPCSGASCNSSPSGKPDRAGVSFNAGTTVNISGGTPGGTPPVNGNAGIDCSGWDAFTDASATLATSTYSASSGPFNASAVEANFGSPSNPKVVVVQGTGGETAQFNGNLNGNGILIIRNSNVVFNGTFTFTGLIIIEDNGGAIRLGGTSKLFGGAMLLNTTIVDSQTELDIQSNPTKLRFSAEGLERASLALAQAGGGSSGLEIIAWRNYVN